jgi:arabinofuranan 3-O-arabinosyltransferase
VGETPPPQSASSSLARFARRIPLGRRALTVGVERIRSAVEQPRAHADQMCAVWPILVSLGAVTAILFGLSEIGGFVPDNRLMQFWNPSVGLDRMRTLWSPIGNLGRVPGERGLVVMGYSTALERLGASPWLIQRVCHITLVAGGAIGTALVARQFLGRSLLGPIVSGLFWIMSTFTVAFLLPSDLYTNAAVAPWLFLAWLHGTTGPSRWRWAACFALGVAVAGFLNPPGLIYAALPLVPLTAYLLGTGQTTWSATGWWVARALPLAVAVSVFDLHRARLLSDAYAQNLATTEAADSVSRSSSWSESLRGMGQWLQYWNPSGTVVQPWLLPLVANPLIVLLSFVPVVVAFAVVASSRWHPRLLFGTILVMSTALMVGLHPLEQPSPLGSLFKAGFEHVPFFFGLRNSYKAGAGWLLATSVLVGYTVTWLTRELTRRRGRVWHVQRLAVATLLVGSVVATSSPVWTGALYDRPDPLDEIPDYWLDALEWLDSRETPARALILPAPANRYRWGNASNGDLFITFLSSPFILDAPLAQPSPSTANLINAVSERISSGAHPHGAMRQLSRRLGVSHVVVRNDIRWETASVVRPAFLDQFRRDPALTLVQTFGEPGENVTMPGSEAPEVLRESMLPPVEIYEVDNVVESIRAMSGPSLLLSGDGAAWPLLAAEGLLDAGNPVRYTAELTARELRRELALGSPVIITDTNRGSNSLFERPGSQSVSIVPDARSIIDLSPSVLLDYQPTANPIAAFDGSTDSVFLTGAYRRLSPSAGVRVELREPTTMSSLSLSAVTDPGYRQVRTVEIVLSTGFRLAADLEDGIATIDFPPAPGVTWFDVRVTALEGDGRGAWGFREIVVPGLDLIEQVEVPDDIVRFADLDPMISDLLDKAALTYQFERRAVSGRPTEPSLRRRFRVPSERAFEGVGTIRALDLSDAELADLIGLTTFGTSTSRSGGSLAASALLAFDGRTDTAWSFDAATRADLDVRFEPVDVTSVRLGLDVSMLDADQIHLDLDIEGRLVSSGTVALPECAGDGGDIACSLDVVLDVPPSRTDDLTVSLTAAHGQRDRAVGGVVRVVEVLVNEVENTPFPAAIPEVCRDRFATLDGAPLGLTFFAPVDALFDGRTMAVDVCGPVGLTAGWHTLVTRIDAPFSTLRLSAVDASGPVAVRVHDVDVVQRADTELVVRVEGPAGTVLVSGQAPSSNWRAIANGVDLGPPIIVDAQMAWVLPDGGAIEVVMAVPAQRMSERLFVVVLVAMALCLALVIGDPRRRTRDDEAESPLSSPAAAVVDAVDVEQQDEVWSFALAAITILLAGLLAGMAGAVLAALVVWLNALRAIRSRAVGWMAVLLVMLAALATVPPLGPVAADVTPQWPNDRWLSWTLARFGAVLLMISMAMAVARQRAVKAERAHREGASCEIVS